MAGNVNARTAASLLKELESDVQEYTKAFVHNPSNDDSNLLISLIGAGVEEARIRKGFSDISVKVNQVISLANRSKDEPCESSDPTPDSLIADAHYYMGQTFRLRKNWKEAQAQFEKSMSIHPGPDAQYFLGVILQETGQSLPAKEAFQKVINDYPQSERAVEANKKLLAPPKSTGCFVATACYGSYDAPEVFVLRRFRDQRLSRSVLGRHVIEVYYKVGPHAARFIDRSIALKALVRGCLFRPLVYILKQTYKENTDFKGNIDESI